MISEKKLLTVQDIEAQSAIELPSRENLALLSVVIAGVLNNNTVNVSIPIQNNKVGVQVCAVIAALNTQAGTTLTCQVTG